MITILGLGFVGLTTGLGFSKKGFKTFGFDINSERLEMLKNYDIPLLHDLYPSQLVDVHSPTYHRLSTLRPLTNRLLWVRSILNGDCANNQLRDIVGIR